MIFLPLFCVECLMYHLHGPSLQDMDSFLAPTQSFPFHWRGGLVQVRVRTLTPLPQVTLQAENALQSEKPPSTAVKQDREHECVTEDHAQCSIKPGRPYRDNTHQFTFSTSFAARDFVRTTDFNYILKRVLFIPPKNSFLEEHLPTKTSLAFFSLATFSPLHKKVWQIFFIL